MPALPLQTFGPVGPKAGQITLRLRASQYRRDPHSIAAAIHKEVLEATAENARLAEHEWRRAVRGQGGGAFSAAPGVSVRPAVGGVEVTIRYVTRASERFGLRARLYQSAVQLLAQNATVAPRV